MPNWSHTTKRVPACYPQPVTGLAIDALIGANVVLGDFAATRAIRRVVLVVTTAVVVLIISIVPRHILSFANVDQFCLVR